MEHVWLLEQSRMVDQQLSHPTKDLESADNYRK
jgi:hypothetical protein